MYPITHATRRVIMIIAVGSSSSRRIRVNPIP